jgi:hypothetical protein
VNQDSNINAAIAHDDLREWLASAGLELTQGG